MGYWTLTILTCLWKVPESRLVQAEVTEVCYVPKDCETATVLKQEVVL